MSMPSEYLLIGLMLPPVRPPVEIKYPTMRVLMRRASKAREGRILFCIRPTSNAAGGDAAAPEWIGYFDRGPYARRQPLNCDSMTGAASTMDHKLACQLVDTMRMAAKASSKRIAMPIGASR